MAFTVDLGITYLLFLDQPYATDGKQVAREVWSAELLAVLTTVGAFLLLLISDFKILAQIGVFSALGVTFTLLFVHFIFPEIFPAMPAAKRQTNRFLFNAIKAVAAPAKEAVPVEAAPVAAKVAEVTVAKEEPKAAKAKVAAPVKAAAPAKEAAPAEKLAKVEKPKAKKTEAKKQDKPAEKKAK